MKAVHNFGAGDLLEIEPAAGGATMLLPFTETIVPTIDVAGRGSWSTRRRKRVRINQNSASAVMAIRLFSKSETHREFSNVAAFGIRAELRAAALPAGR